MISFEYSLKFILGMFSIIKNVSYECLYVMNLYIHRFSKRTSLGMFNMFNMLVDVYIQYAYILVFKWFSIISNVQYLMLFRNVS